MKSKKFLFLLALLCAGEEINEVGGVNDNNWYSLDGRRLSHKPSRAGVYIKVI